MDVESDDNESKTNDGGQWTGAVEQDTGAVTVEEHEDTIAADVLEEENRIQP